MEESKVPQSKGLVNPYLNPLMQTTQKEEERWNEQDSMMDDEAGNSVI